MEIHFAEARDLPAVRRLLESQHLPLDGVDEHVSTMVVARKGSEVVGAAAVELYADGALLRSVVVVPAARGRGVGQRLTEAAVSLAQSLGMPAVYLLTTSAESYFPKFGFVPTARDRVPASVQQSIEFRFACPASALVMWKPLNESAEEEQDAIREA